MSTLAATAIRQFRGLLVGSALVASLPALAQTYEPTLPHTAAAAESSGYFPTATEDILLRGSFDARSLGTGMVVDGPDNDAQIAQDIFPYENTNGDFYERNRDIFRPLNRALGVFTPFDAFTLESRRLQNAVLTVDADLSLLTRSFEPDLAHIKAGPLYFDVLWLGAGVAYSDYSGEKALAPREVDGDSAEDGWTGFVELGVRGLIRFTDSIYISAVANIIYLPFENELGIGFGNSQYGGINVRFTLNEIIAGWEIMFFDEFLGRPGLNFFPDADATAFDQAGRYTFGFMGQRSAGFFNNDLVYFGNTVGFRASRPVLDNQWRLGFLIEHTDSWRSFNFDDHGKLDTAGVWLQYEGSVIPFAPMLSYQYFSSDGYRSLMHALELQLTGRLTENVSWLGRAGYMFSTGDTDERNGFIWEAALDHTLTRSTHHWLSAGETFAKNEYQADTRTMKYIRYGIDQRFTSRFHARAFVQFSENETSARDLFPARDRFGVGLDLVYRPLDFTNITASVLYEQLDQITTDEDMHRWLYRLEANQQLAHRLTGNIFYQYEEINQDANAFTEHFVGMSLRRYF